MLRCSFTLKSTKAYKLAHEFRCLSGYVLRSRDECSKTSDFDLRNRPKHDHCRSAFPNICGIWQPEPERFQDSVWFQGSEAVLPSRAPRSACLGVLPGRRRPKRIQGTPNIGLTLLCPAQNTLTSGSASQAKGRVYQFRWPCLCAQRSTRSPMPCTTTEWHR